MAAPSTRDRISVDLRGLKAELIERSTARGLSLSDFVRNVLLEALRSGSNERRASSCASAPEDIDRVRLSVRLTRAEARALAQAAQAAHLPVGALVSRLARDTQFDPALRDAANHCEPHRVSRRPVGLSQTGLA